MDINGIAVTSVSLLPAWRDGMMTQDQVVAVTEPLSAEQVAELTDGTGWTVTDGEQVRTVEGVDSLREVRYTFCRIKSELTIAKEQAEAELEQVISDARSGLLAAPEAGEAWNEAKWYRAGDTVTHNESTYECVKTCKGKEPGTDSLINYWNLAVEEEPIEVLVWSELESGTTITVGQIVTHNDKTWECLKEHTKSVIRQPSAVQPDYWQEVTL